MSSLCSLSRLYLQVFRVPLFRSQLHRLPILLSLLVYIKRSHFHAVHVFHPYENTTRSTWRMSFCFHTILTTVRTHYIAQRLDPQTIVYFLKKPSEHLTAAKENRVLTAHTHATNPFACQSSH